MLIINKFAINNVNVKSSANCLAHPFFLLPSFPPPLLPIFVCLVDRGGGGQSTFSFLFPIPKMGRAICIFQIKIFLVKLLASLLLVKSEQEQQPRLINGRLYAYMEPCPLPNVRLLGQTPSAAVVKIGESPPPPPPASAAAAGHFQLELPSSGGNVQIEAECPPKEAGANPSKSIYDLELAKIDWTGANELLLFNDVHILAFGYPEQQQAIGLA